ncbi:MAG: outer membrane lipoprotein carrier protein LolA [Acidobacteriota bacterium]|nr:outer membrane lipoprotein carrier protein LolA [Acidobacteriota bacterium]
MAQRLFERSQSLARQVDVTRIALWCLLSLPLFAAEPDVKSVLKGVENRYNRARTLQVQFTETYTGQGRPRQQEAGQLVLRKPGRMRWDYSLPAGKLFLSDGKNVYLYSPDAKRVERMPLKESEDMRAPLAFLLGKLDFGKEFRDISMKSEAENHLISATAKSDKLPYDRIEMLITPGFEIRRLLVNGLDKSVLTYRFDQEKLNPQVDDGQFKFQMPAGATLVNPDIAQ